MWPIMASTCNICTSYLKQANASHSLGTETTCSRHKLPVKVKLHQNKLLGALHCVQTTSFAGLYREKKADKGRDEESETREVKKKE